MELMNNAWFKPAEVIRRDLNAPLWPYYNVSERMHDPVPQTGGWLKSVVQGHFNYYAVPGNLMSLGVFRDRVLALWWRLFAAGVRNAGSTGRTSSLWLSDGFLNRERSIPSLTLASPPLIRDKNRMR